MRKSIELKNEKGQLTEQYRAILNKADAEKRQTNTEEKEQLRKMDARFEELDSDISTLEKQESREASLAAGGSGSSRSGATQPANSDGKRSGAKAKRGNPVRATAEYAEAYNQWLTGARPEDMAPEIRNALTADSDTGGGYTVASEQFADRLIEAVDDVVYIRGMATITALTSAQSLGIPTRDGDVDDADWTSEVATGSEDTGLKFGKRELRPHPLAKRVKLSKKLLRLTPWIEDKIIQRLGYKFGISQEKGFLLGTGVQQPLGVFTASSDGISTARDKATGSATGFVAAPNGADCLIDALYSLKQQYQRVAVWGFHRTTVSMIRKLKDSYGQYLWQPGIAGDKPDTILNRPFFMSEYIPSTYTTGKYIGILGDFSKYEIAEALNIEIQRLIELYAETNQIGYIGRMEVDGMPVLEEAFVRIQLS